MKKNVLLFILIFINGFVFGQEVKFEEVVNVDSSINAKNLHSNAIIWINDTYKSGKAVIQMDDKENGIIIGKAVMKYEPDFYMANIPARGYINYTVKISCKDGRYKYEIYDFVHDGTTNRYGQNGSIGLINEGKYTGSSKALNKGFRNKVNEDAIKQVKKYIPDVVSSLKIAMQKSIEKNDNW